MIEILFILTAIVILIFLASAASFAFVKYGPVVIRNPGYFIVTLVFVLNILPVGGGSEDGSVVKQLGWIFIFLLGCISIFRINSNKFLEMFWRLPFWLVALVVFSVISVLWSEFQLISIKRVGQIVGILVVAVALFQNSEDGMSMVKFSMPLVVTFLLLGILMALANPGYSFESDGSFRGIASHKNTWGQFSLFCSIILLASILHRGVVSIRMGLIIAIAMGSVLVSKSTTSLIVLLSVFLLLGGFEVLRRHRILMIGSIAGFSILSALIAFVFFVVNGDFSIDFLLKNIMVGLGKSETLTGRTKIWDLMFSEISRHPLLGTGFGGFWVDGGSASAQVTSSFYLKINQAHSGYIDLLNEVGIVGSVIATLMLANHIKDIFVLFQMGIRSPAYYHSGITLAALILNYSESSILRITHFWWVILCFSIVEVHYMSKRRLDKSATVPSINNLLHHSAA